MLSQELEFRSAKLPGSIAEGRLQASLLQGSIVRCQIDTTDSACGGDAHCILRVITDPLVTPELLSSVDPSIIDCP